MRSLLPEFIGQYLRRRRITGQVERLGEYSIQLQRTDIGVLETLIIISDLYRYLLEELLLREPTRVELHRTYNLRSGSITHVLDWVRKMRDDLRCGVVSNQKLPFIHNSAQPIIIHDWLITHDGSRQLTVVDILSTLATHTGDIVDFYEGAAVFQQRQIEVHYRPVAIELQIVVGDFILGYIDATGGNHG